MLTHLNFFCVNFAWVKRFWVDDGQFCSLGAVCNKSHDMPSYTWQCPVTSWHCSACPWQTQASHTPPYRTPPTLRKPEMHVWGQNKKWKKKSDWRKPQQHTLIFSPFLRIFCLHKKSIFLLHNLRHACVTVCVTSQDVPAYPGGHEHISTADALLFPLSWGLATSIENEWSLYKYKQKKEINNSKQKIQQTKQNKNKTSSMLVAESWFYS